MQSLRRLVTEPIPKKQESHSLSLEMRVLHSFLKTRSSSRCINIVLVSIPIFVIYLIISIRLARSSDPAHASSPELSVPTSLDHIVFGIASNERSWPGRKEYVRLWWDPRRMRGCVFLEQTPPGLNSTDASLPPVCISEDTSRFRYTHKGGLPSAIRVARVVSETVALNHSGAQWYVFGDDDTVFFPENLVKTLSKYDHGLWYYIGTNSEIYEQNKFFGFQMAFGGGGFAVSSPLAKVLAKVFDNCIERYPHLYGSDARVYSCLAELGIGLTHEPGFHQMDVRGDAFGLLAAHPVRPLVSLHHLDLIDPIFPNKSSAQALEHLFEAAKLDSQRLLHQTVCYDRWFSWTISVSWGYAVQVFPNHVFLPDTISPHITFRQWKEKRPNALSNAYNFNTREHHPDPCQRPTVFFFDSAYSTSNGIESTYRKAYVNCTRDMASPRKLERIKVLSQKLNLDTKQLQAPRRHCCEVLPSSVGQVMEIAVRECKEEELIYMH